MKEWFRFSYLANYSNYEEEKYKLCLFSEVILDRFVLIEDTIENITEVWAYLKKEKGFIRVGDYDKLGVSPNLKKVGYKIIELNNVIK